MLIHDEEGDALPDAAAACVLAFETLREMMRLPHIDGPPRDWRQNVFVITDESGTVLDEVPYDGLL